MCPLPPGRSHDSFLCTRANTHTHARAGGTDLRRRWTHTWKPIGEPRLGQLFISRSHPRPQDLLPLENVPRSANDFQNSSWKHRRVFLASHFRTSRGPRKFVNSLEPHANILDRLEILEHRLEIDIVDDEEVLRELKRTFES